MVKRIHLIVLLVLLQAVTGVAVLYAQSMTSASGIVKDSITGEPLAFVSVYFDGSTIGAMTDDNGAFALQNDKGYNKLAVASLGYDTKILDLKTGSLRFCNAGHNPPIIIGADGNTTLLKAKIQLFVGVLEDMEYTDEEITLEKNTRLFLYTDGITEAENASKELYGEDRLLSTLAPLGTFDVRIIVDTVVRSVASHVQQAEASDDMTILLIHYEPKTIKP